MTSRIIGSIESLIGLHNDLPSFVNTVNSLVDQANMVYQEMLDCASAKTEQLNRAYDAAVSSVEHLRDCSHDREDDCSCLAEYERKISSFQSQYHSAMSKIEEIVRPPMQCVKTTPMYSAQQTIHNETLRYADGLRGLISYAQTYLNVS